MLSGSAHEVHRVVIFRDSSGKVAARESREWGVRV